MIREGFKNKFLKYRSLMLRLVLVELLEKYFSDFAIAFVMKNILLCRKLLSLDVK